MGLYTHDKEFPIKGGITIPNIRSGLAIDGGFIQIFYFHPDPWGNNPITSIIFKWVVQPPTSGGC